MGAWCSKVAMIAHACAGILPDEAEGWRRMAGASSLVLVVPFAWWRVSASGSVVVLSVFRCRFAQGLLPIGQVRIRWDPAATEAAGHPQGVRGVAVSVVGGSRSSRVLRKRAVAASSAIRRQESQPEPQAGHFRG